MSATVRAVDVVGKRIPYADDFPVTYGDSGDTEHVFVRLRTDDGPVGYGEGTALPWFTGESTEDMAAVVERWLTPRVEGESVREGLVALDEFGDQFPGNPGARAAVELALLDLRGKVAGLPVSAFLGVRRRETVPVVYTIPGLEPGEAADLAAEQVDRGFDRFKVKATGDVPTDTARINRVLDVLPAGATARIDANTGWETAPATVRAVDGIDHPAKVEYLEQPVATDRTEDLRQVWDETGIPVYADESIHGPGDVEAVGRRGLAAGCHLKLAKAGSLVEESHMARTARRHGLRVTVVSALGTSLDAAANLHLAAVVPTLSAGCELGAVYLEEDPVTDQLGRSPEMPVPTGDGIGVELDDNLFE